MGWLGRGAYGEGGGVSEVAVSELRSGIEGEMARLKTAIEQQRVAKIKKQRNDDRRARDVHAACRRLCAAFNGNSASRQWLESAAPEQARGQAAVRTAAAVPAVAVPAARAAAAVHAAAVPATAMTAPRRCTRRVRARRQHAIAVQRNRGTLLACPGTIQGQSGWYEYDGQMVRYDVSAGGEEWTEAERRQKDP